MLILFWKSANPEKFAKRHGREARSLEAIWKEFNQEMGLEM